MKSGYSSLRPLCHAGAERTHRMTLDLVKLVAKGESRTLELKRSTGELREALQSICAFANGTGGRVLIGVKPDGQIVGQQVSEQTFHEIAAARERFEPPIDLDVSSVEVAPGRMVLVLSVAGTSDSVPFTYDGRAFERVDSTTRKMGQEGFAPPLTRPQAPLKHLRTLQWRVASIM